MADHSKKELLAIHGVGPKAITVLGDALAVKGLAFQIQERRELIPGSPTIGAEPTVRVDDVAGCVERAEAAGGSRSATRT